MDQLDEEYKRAIIKISKDIPLLIKALNDHTTKMERFIKLS